MLYVSPYYRGRLQQRGGGGGIGRGAGYYDQRGAGIGNFLKTMFRALIPFARKGTKALTSAALKASKSKLGKQVIKQVKSGAKKSALKSVSRALEGKDLVEGAKSDLAEAKKKLAVTFDKAAAAGDNGGGGGGGNGGKRKRKGTLAIVPKAPLKKAKKKSGSGGSWLV